MTEHVMIKMNIEKWIKLSWILQKFDLDLFSSCRNTAVSGVMLKQELRFAKVFDSIMSIYINIL